MDLTDSRTGLSEVSVLDQPAGSPELAVSLLTGGSDRPYVWGLTTSIVPRGAMLDLIGSDELDFPEFRGRRGIRFLNLRGSTQSETSLPAKISRILLYYIRLMAYGAIAKPKIFHILWNNKFETFDRTLLMMYYKFLGKKIVFTAHNVNTRRRDSEDSWLNRLTLRTQYRLADHIFAHTENMRHELIVDFGVKPARVTTIPFGINNAVPDTSLTAEDAKERLGLSKNERAILFFGRITPYKGLDSLMSAFRQVDARSGDHYRLIIAGRPDRCDEYWSAILSEIAEAGHKDRILLNADFVPDSDVEVYFKAADLLVLPYRDIYQSGVIFLGQSFGLPVLATDVGSLKDEIDEGRTGFVCKPEDTADLAATIEKYFASDLYADLNRRRPEIRSWATARHSWDLVGDITMETYARLLGMPNRAQAMARDISADRLTGNARGARGGAVPVAGETRN
jgi:glycosyltransferase involved in cell wall biosynthesis